jgi:hypothetical protein
MGQLLYVHHHDNIQNSFFLNSDNKKKKSMKTFFKNISLKVKK